MPRIAYDFETDAIAAGTPGPRYLVMVREDDDAVLFAEDIRRLSWRDVLVRYFLRPEFAGYRFVAYNGNRFDAHFLLKAMSEVAAVEAMPFLAGSNALRGVAVTLKENPKIRWTFSDAIAMTGFTGKLASFIKAFGNPGDAKLAAEDITDFNPESEQDRAYALADTRCLAHAMKNWAKELHDFSGAWPGNTVGAMAIKLFQSKLPDGVLIWEAPAFAKALIEGAKRGGYVWTAGRYRGPAYGYDINQCYAAQMRNPLPCGRAVRVRRENPGKLGIYRAIVYRRTPERYVPFYATRVRSNERLYIDGSQPELVYLCTPEVVTLRELGWKVDVLDGVCWSESFNMSPWVDELEAERARLGPKSPGGLVVKSIGNNAFGKTLEGAHPMRTLISRTRPDGGVALMPEQSAVVWGVKEEKDEPEYHRPQIGVFIMAYGRCQLMRTAAKAPAYFLKADTDGITFARDMRDMLWIDATRYGAFKCEYEATEIMIFAKKCYCYAGADAREVLERVQADPYGVEEICGMKGIRARELSWEDRIAWFSGNPPSQKQIQVNNVIKQLSGAPMYKDAERRASAVLPYLERPEVGIMRGKLIGVGT